MEYIEESLNDSCRNNSADKPIQSVASCKFNDETDKHNIEYDDDSKMTIYDDEDSEMTNSDDEDSGITNSDDDIYDLLSTSRQNHEELPEDITISSCEGSLNDNLENDLRNWAHKFGLSLITVSALLCFLKNYVGVLPADARTLMNTPISVIYIIQIAPGNCFHYGFKKAIQNILIGLKLLKNFLQI